MLNPVLADYLFDIPGYRDKVLQELALYAPKANCNN